MFLSLGFKASDSNFESKKSIVEVTLPRCHGRSCRSLTGVKTSTKGLVAATATTGWMAAIRHDVARVPASGWAQRGILDQLPVPES
jgi:hypothetical protein